MEIQSGTGIECLLVGILTRCNNLRVEGMKRDLHVPQHEPEVDQQEASETH